MRFNNVQISISRDELINELEHEFELLRGWIKRAEEESNDQNINYAYEHLGAIRVMLQLFLGNEQYMSKLSSNYEYYNKRLLQLTGFLK
jgi:hypothetical protein